MIPWEAVAEASVPEGGTLRLMRRGDEFAIRLGTVELMNSRRGGSETALGTLACRSLEGRSRPRLLVGGLGMGFTLRACLAALGPDATVVVAELVPAVIAWARGPLADLFDGSLDDPRTALVEADVAALIIEPGGYDAILLDVDNGPAGQVRPGNDDLYAPRGLAAARRALRSGGLLAFWAAEANAGFAARVSGAGFAVETVHARSGGRGGARHAITLARRA